MTRIPFNDRRPLDPRRCPIAIDANALNRDGSTYDRLVDRLLELATCSLNLILPKGVRQEILDHRTPDHIRIATGSMLYSLPVGLNAEEQQRRQLIEQEMQGNAKPGKHTADADHLFEASKYGGFFITHDQRILDKAGKLRALLPPSLTVVTLKEFLDIYEQYERQA